ncbi:MAG TPA: O-antigen ligase family protein [Blastocatellia bacterium]|nr:O-antigen ligase family protein [Blastocatellia bacterium]
MISRPYSRILVVVAVALFFTGLDVYLFTSEMAGLPPLYFIIGFIVVAAPLLFSNSSLVLLRQSSLARWCLGFFMISGLWFLLQPLISDDAFQELRIRFLSVSFILVLLCLLRSEDALLWMRRTIFASVLLAIGLNVYELFSPLTFSSVAGRSAGFYINPNISGAALVVGMILTIGLLPQRYRMLFAAAVGTGVFLTFSRSAIAGWFISMLAIVITRQISLRKSLIIAGSVIAISSLLIISEWDQLRYQLEDAGVLNSNVTERLEWLSNLTANDASATDRYDVVGIAFEKFADSPIVGNGIGASHKLLWTHGDIVVSSHNQYINLMVDHGALGIFILPLFVAAVVWRARGDTKQIAVTFAIFILFMGFFSHNLLEERYILLPATLLSAMALASRRETVVDTGGKSLIMRRAA